MSTSKHFSSFFIFRYMCTGKRVDLSMHIVFATLYSISYIFLFKTLQLFSKENLRNIDENVFHFDHWILFDSSDYFRVFFAR